MIRLILLSEPTLIRINYAGLAGLSAPNRGHCPKSHLSNLI
jgi:hypothetical protein